MSGQGGWNAQGGYPPGQGGYPPGQGGYPQGQGGYPQGRWTAQGQSQPPGWNPNGPRSGYPGGPGPGGPSGARPGGSGGKSPLLIVGIVIAAVVLLVAVGGIFIALAGGGSGTPGAPITPDASQAPSAPPSTASSPGSPGSGRPGSSKPSASSTGSGGGGSGGGGGGGGGQTGAEIDLGDGISLTPASGWTVESQKSTLAVLTNGEELFVGQVVELDSDADPKQVVDNYHRQLAKNYTDVSYVDAKTTDLGTSKLKGASGSMSGTSSSSQGSVDVSLYTVGSVRTKDGVTVVGTIYLTTSSDTSAAGKDFGIMVNSMLAGQS